MSDDLRRDLQARAAAAGLTVSELLRCEPDIAGQPPVADVLARAAARPGGAAHREIVAAIRAARGANAVRTFRASRGEVPGTCQAPGRACPPPRKINWRRVPVPRASGGRVRSS
jgi:hypothetical protein